jgi:hypothetical protein
VVESNALLKRRRSKAYRGFESLPLRHPHSPPSQIARSCQSPALRMDCAALRPRQQFLIFLLCWITFGWFHQGGGWNQNARFAEVRAIVEQGRFAIDDYLVYSPNGDLHERAPIVEGRFTRDQVLHVLCWASPGNTPVPVDGKPLPPAAKIVLVGQDTASGDVGYGPDGHFHSNKPPGTTLLAAPIYFVAFHLEKLFGASPEHWWVLNLNLWLCSVFTVGLASAIGVLLVWRQGASLFPGKENAALAAALSFGFGTTFFPFGTLLFDHNLTAVLLLGCFAAIRSDRPILAGLLVGIATLTNYLAAVPGIAFGFWLLSRRRTHALPYLGGVLPSAVLLLAYNAVALGSPFALNTNFQNPQFKEVDPALFGMFTLPSWFATQALLTSPWRGVFVLSPILILAIAALFRWPEKFRAERRLIVGITLFLFVVNISFNGFHAGMSAGPRYLIPALPFLCLALVPAFAAWPVAATALAVVSIVQQSLLTITDALNPVGVSDHAWQNHPDEWKEKLSGNSIVWQYAWPIFSSGRAWPVIRKEFVENGPYRKPGSSPVFLPEYENYEPWIRVKSGERSPVPLAAMPGPVSINVVSAVEGGFFQHTEPYVARASWAAFNAGEFLFPQSRWSLAPLFLLWLGGAVLLRRFR